MSEDGECRREVRHATEVECPDGRRPDYKEMQHEPSSSGTLPSRPGFAAQPGHPTHPSLYRSNRNTGRSVVSG
ncbi:hypothetical protein [Thermincola ferriacetica]|uniref:hypothetical protein n=1 Tax=Thermincola ferriacetica TaxID=281456 RepID=UPI00128B2F6D|nr:hypothetical protein [Thermincola ferriacetica]